MKFNWSKIATAIFLLTGFVTTAIIIKEYGFSEIINSYENFDILLVFGYLFATVIIYLCLTWRWNIIARSMGHKITFKKLFIYKVIGNAINFFTLGPRIAGEATQVRLLENHKIKPSHALSTIVVDKMVETTTSGILFIVGLFLVSLKYAIPQSTGAIMIFGGIILTLVIGLFYYRMLNSKHFFLHIFKFLRLNKPKNRFLKSTEKGIINMELRMIKFYKRDHKVFALAIAISLLSWIAMFIEYKILATILGMNLGFIELFFIITFIGLAVLFPLPLSIGVLEAGQVSAFSILRLSGTAGVALAFLVRIKDIMWGILGMIFLAIYGFKIKPFTPNKSERAKIIKTLKTSKA
jgi:glycosyltransferase 2 family protein